MVKNSIFCSKVKGLAFLNSRYRRVTISRLWYYWLVIQLNFWLVGKTSMNLGKSSKYLYQIITDWRGKYSIQVSEQNSDVQRLRPKCVASDDFLSVLIGKHRRKIYFGKSAVCLKLLNTVYNFFVLCSVIKNYFLCLKLCTNKLCLFHLIISWGQDVDYWNWNFKSFVVKKRLLFFSFLTCSLDSTYFSLFFNRISKFSIRHPCRWDEMDTRNSCWKLEIHLNILLL